MVLGGNKKLQDNVFCLTEERNYFQSKYLEQISEISALQNELANSKREIQKLRHEVMSGSVAAMSIKDENKEEDASTITLQTTERQPASVGPDGVPEPNLIDKENQGEKEEEEHFDADESYTSSEEEEEEEEQDEKKKLRSDAEKLLQWADYRESVTGGRTSLTSSVGSRASSNRQSLGVPRTIKSSSLVAEEDALSHTS